LNQIAEHLNNQQVNIPNILKFTDQEKNWTSKKVQELFKRIQSKLVLRYREQAKDQILNVLDNNTNTNSEVLFRLLISI
jgi:uncharacterized FlaG/YvyC family protein